MYPYRLLGFNSHCYGLQPQHSGGGGRHEFKALLSKVPELECVSLVCTGLMLESTCSPPPALQEGRKEGRKKGEKEERREKGREGGKNQEKIAIPEPNSSH